VTGGTASGAPAGHAEQADQPGQVTEEPTMRHALIPIHLIQDARAAAEPARQVADAPPDPVPADPPKRRRVATLFARARALVARPT
jgi:hypothetical protein